MRVGGWGVLVFLCHVLLASCPHSLLFRVWCGKFCDHTERLQTTPAAAKRANPAARAFYCSRKFKQKSQIVVNITPTRLGSVSEIKRTHEPALPGSCICSPDHLIMQGAMNVSALRPLWWRLRFSYGLVQRALHFEVHLSLFCVCVFSQFVVC